MGKAGHKAIRHDIAVEGHHDGQRRGRRVHGAGGFGRAGDDQLNALRQQLARQGIKAAYVAIGIGQVELDVAAFVPAQVSHALPERRHIRAGAGRRAAGHHTHAAQWRAGLGVPALMPG